MAQEGKEGYLTGKLLLAMPGMQDPRFHRAVIFLCSHGESGAMGLVINHIVPGVQFDKLVGHLNLESDIKVKLDPVRFPVMSGGPIETARGFLLHSGNFKRNETLTIDNDYALTGTVDALKDVIRGQGPDHMLFILGYAGWSSGQLDEELQQNSWLVVDPDPSLVFEAQPEEKWTRAVQKLGIDPAMLSGVSGRA